MRLNKMTGRVIATMGIAAMMMTQTAGVMAAEQTENKQLKKLFIIIRQIIRERRSAEVRFRQQDADQPQLLYATVL